VVRDLAVSPINPNQVYAVTNEKGLARISSDGGRNWTISRLPDGTTEVYSVAILPASPTEVYFGTSNGIFRYNCSSWLHMGLDGYRVYALGYHPVAAKGLIAGTHAGGFLALSGSSTSWTSIAGDLAGKMVVSLNFDPLNPRYVYAGTQYQGTLRVPIEAWR
jgi:hypothetical protein